MARAQRQCVVLRKRTYSKPSCVWILLAQERIFCALVPRWRELLSQALFQRYVSRLPRGCIFIIFISGPGRGPRRGPAPAPAPAPVPIPGPDDSGRAMHIQLTFQLKSLCKAATKGGPTKRKASKVRTSSKPKLSAVQTPGSHNQWCQRSQRTPG